MKLFLLAGLLLGLSSCVGHVGSFPMMISHGLADKKTSDKVSPGNPYASDKSSAARGKEIYLRHCTRCHGDKGMGDGLEAKQLQMKPANLQVLKKDFPDYYFYRQVSVGREKMPSWKDVLSDQQIWDLVNYITKEM